jgi:hypothetical protein
MKNKKVLLKKGDFVKLVEKIAKKVIERKKNEKK